MSLVVWRYLKQRDHKSVYFILPVSRALDSVSKCHLSPQFYAVQEGPVEAGFHSAIAFKCTYFELCYTPILMTYFIVLTKHIPHIFKKISLL